MRLVVGHPPAWGIRPGVWMYLYMFDEPRGHIGLFWSMTDHDGPLCTRMDHYGLVRTSTDCYI